MVLICAAAFLASTLTFFSGFGLGTLLTPVFALFFPIQTAIAATAIVHLANNLFKVGLVGTLIVSFALLETSARFRSVQLPSRYLPWGGALAGFFGGLSGTQGALRSAFLIKAGLSKQGFVATGVVCAVLVDVVRLIVYGASQVSAHFDAVPRQAVPMVAAATISAFAGALVGARVLRQLALETVRTTVAVMMVAIGMALAAGLL